MSCKTSAFIRGAAQRRVTPLATAGWSDRSQRQSQGVTASTTTDFFSGSAQVIPVLFIAIAFEHRAFGRLDDEPEKDVLLAAARLMAFALTLWGEVSALSAVSAHRGSGSEHGAVSTALIA
jgi:hypothetical protein